MKIIGIENNVKCSIDFDYYVPLTISTTSPKIVSPKTFFRFGNTNKALLEIAICNYNGMIQDITLLISNNVSINNNPIIDYPNPIQGMPTIDLANYEGKTSVDIPISFETTIHPSQIRITLKRDNLEAGRSFQIGNLIVVINTDSEIVSIIINNISEKNIECFKEAMHI